MQRRDILGYAFACLMLVLSAAATAAPVGEVLAVKGSAHRQSGDGPRIALVRGDKVYEQDLLETQDQALLAVRFTDGTRFNLGPRTSFRVDQVSDGEAGVFSAEVLRGAFRFVTGLIAKRRTGGEVDGESATIVLLESEEPGTPSAIEVGNEHGSVVIDQPGYGTRVPDAHSPPSPPERMSLRTIENLVRNINNIQRIAVPRPGIH